MSKSNSATLVPAMSADERAKLAKLGGSLSAWAKADKAEQGALVNVFRTCAEFGIEPKPEHIAKHCPAIGESSRPVYASTFAKAAKVAKVLGAPATLDLIDRAAAMPGKKWELVRDALGAVQAMAKLGGVKLATEEQRATFATGALLEQTMKADARAKAKADAKEKAKADRAPQAPKAPEPQATMAQEARQDLIALQALTAKVTRYACPPERAKAQAKAVKLLQDAHEALSVLAK